MSWITDEYQQEQFPAIINDNKWLFIVERAGYRLLHWQCRAYNRDTEIKSSLWESSDDAIISVVKQIEML